MWIVIAGDVVDGLFFYGPFETKRQAEDWHFVDGQQGWREGEEGCIAPLVSPQAKAEADKLIYTTD